MITRPVMARPAAKRYLGRPVSRSSGSSATADSSASGRGGAVSGASFPSPSASWDGVTKSSRMLARDGPNQVVGAETSAAGALEAVAALPDDLPEDPETAPP